MQPSSCVLELAGVGKTVPSPSGELTLLADIDLRIEAGESIAIVGPSGSGKSTLLGLMAGLDLPSQGTIRLQGTELTALDEDARAAARRGRVGFVFQSFQLLSNLTALENVMLPLELEGESGADVRDQALGLLERVGLADRAGHYPNQLSGGEQQRVALARGFAVDPAILFADEPTGNLDRHTGAQIADLLFGLNRERGTTLVLVTHDPDLSAHCRRQLGLDGGRLTHPA